MDADRLQQQDWLRQARFGMFMHYGLYSVSGRHEWVQNHESIPAEKHRVYFDHFIADRFDARAWARAAKDAGMRYLVFTSKHHEGFSMWDTAVSDFSVTHTPTGRDLVAEITAACREEGIRVGLYYSLIDWHHEDFPLDGLHPDWSRRADVADRNGAKYADFLHAQVEELVTRFDPDLLWFDFSYPGARLVEGGKGADFWRSAELFQKIRTLSPRILLNDRLDLPGTADFVTPEEVQPVEGVLDGDAMLWEACRTLNGSWGYAPGYQSWLDADQVVRLLVDSVSKGGNLLLNVGPTARGDIEQRAQDLLHEVGAWVELHSDAVHGAGGSDIPAPIGCRVTRNVERIFVHIFDWPSGHLVLQGLPRAVRFARFLHDGVEVPHEVVGAKPLPVPHLVPAGPDGSTVLKLPLSRPNVLVPVIELDLAPDLG